MHYVVILYVYVYVHKVHVCVYIYLCMHVCMYVCMYVCMRGISCVHIYANPPSKRRFPEVCGSVTVAWDMTRAGNLLVPHLDGQGYTHKPPLLFWAIRLVWAVAGVSETAARLVPVGFAAGLLWATHALGRRLWPERPGVAPLAEVTTSRCTWVLR